MILEVIYLSSVAICTALAIFDFRSSVRHERTRKALLGEAFRPSLTWGDALFFPLVFGILPFLNTGWVIFSFLEFLSSDVIKRDQPN